jgi:hypothetical protein
LRVRWSTVAPVGSTSDQGIREGREVAGLDGVGKSSAGHGEEV